MINRILSFLIAALFTQETAFAGDEAEKNVDRIMSAMEVILEHHIEPPTRQEMVLAAARALDPEKRLSREVSELANQRALRKYLVDLWRKKTDGVAGPSRATLPDRFMNAMLKRVGAGTGLHHHVISDADYLVNRQLADNRYVGIGIHLGATRGYPTAMNVFEDGPAARAGMKRSDMMVAINGKDMEGVALPEVIKILRGQEGQTVNIEVRHPTESEEATRTLEFKRGVAPLKTISYRRHVHTENEHVILGVTINSITGSTLHELRQAETSDQGTGINGVVLDLRSLGNADRHHTVTLANGLLDGGTMGELVGVKGVRRFEADRECLFRGLPMAVLVNSRTSGMSEWLAAALQSNQRAMIVGGQTAGQQYIGEPVPLPDGGAIVLATHRWVRAAKGPNLESGMFRRHKATWSSRSKAVWPDVFTIRETEQRVPFSDFQTQFRTWPPSIDQETEKKAIELLRDTIALEQLGEQEG